MIKVNMVKEHEYSIIILVSWSKHILPVINVVNIQQ